MDRAGRMGVVVAAACFIGACGGDDAATGGGGEGGGSGGGGGATACGAEAVPDATTAYRFEHGGLDRGYELFVPSTFDGSSPLPLVLNFHGYTSKPDEQGFFSGLNALAEQESFLVAYPEGVEKSFNGGTLCCGEAAAQNLDDVGFARAIVADVAIKACVDDTRVYSTGMSNGGFMSHRMACEAADLVAAVAPVAGANGVTATCSPSRPVPIIQFYGTTDPLMPYTAGTASNSFWVGQYNCADAAPEVTFQNGVATCETWDECDAGVSVTMCSIEGGGHCWPGQSFCPPSFGASTTDISANEQMWALFQQHSLE